MLLKLNEGAVKDNFGDVIFIGLEVRYEYDNDKRAYTDKIQSVKAHLGCDKMENSFDVEVASQEMPNVKKWGRVKFEGLEYDPFAGINSYERDGATRSRGALNDRFRCICILPATANDRIADENGVALDQSGSGQKSADKK